MRTATRGRPLSKIRRLSRTLPVKEEQRYGVGENGNKYFKCWNCGFKCKEGRDSLGGSSDKANISYSINYDVPYNTLVMLRSHLIAVRTDLDGDAESENVGYDIEGTGCPLCHTKNWRGDY